MVGYLALLQQASFRERWRESHDILHVVWGVVDRRENRLRRCVVCALRKSGGLGTCALGVFDLGARQVGVGVWVVGHVGCVSWGGMRGDFGSHGCAWVFPLMERGEWRGVS